jgi:hypothetical protein
MFLTWKVAYFTGGFAPLLDAADAGGAGGGADLGGGGDDSQSSDASADGEDAGDEGVASAGDEPAREEALEDLLLDDEEDDNQAARPAEERIKALAKKNRKIRKQLAKLLPLSKRLQGVDLDDLVLSKRQYEQLAAQIRDNPRLRALFNGDAEEPATERRTPATEVVEEQFDEKVLPFDPNENPTNRYFANLAKENFETRKLLKQLQGRLDGVDGREQQRSESQVREVWKSTIVSAAAHIEDEGVRDLFKDALAAAYRDPEVRKKYTPQQLVSHYLAKLKVDPSEAAKANKAAAKTATATTPVRTAATQARIAEQNKTLPRTVAAGGSPAPARSNRPTLTSLRKQITGAAR